MSIFTIDVALCLLLIFLCLEWSDSVIAKQKVQKVLRFVCQWVVFEKNFLGVKRS